ncbi:MAG: DUF2235 domain-containing protein, partial [Rhizobiales bacterium]|nr:DUF2235 domain-containing protein [Hyphomicrobiales bacterium]
YRQLCHRYKPGDGNLCFGFSRGAFSARSFVGYVHAPDVLRAEHCSTTAEKKAWAFYRTPKRYRVPAEKKALEKLCWPADKLRVRCLGVFDTVGARGIPASVLRYRNVERYGFHDTNLSSIVDYAFHAMALDEKRRHYVPTLWSYAFHQNNKGIEQVWFPGCHSDVGGVVESDWLSSIPLYWMIRRIQENKLGLVLHEVGIEKIREERDEAANMLGGKGAFYRLLSVPPAHRKVSQTQPNESGDVFVGLERHLKPMREAVHWSIFARMQQLRKYQPVNIFDNSDFWDSVMVDGTPHDTDVVGRNEHFLEWWQHEEDYHAMGRVLPQYRVPHFWCNAEKYVPELKRRRLSKSVRRRKS